MLKQILSVIIGYAIFVASSLALFNISGIKPHSDASTNFMLLTAVYGATFSFVSGLATQSISKTNNLKINYILAVIIAGFAIFSYFKASGSHWTQVMAIFIFAPMSIIGGLVYLRKNK